MKHAKIISIKTHENYKSLSKEIESIEGAKTLDVINALGKEYPLYQIRQGKGRKVIISGCVHGDEPAGAYAILHFFQNYAKDYLNDFEFTAYHVSIQGVLTDL